MGARTPAFDGHARIYVNANRQNSGEKWVWSYFEPRAGLDPFRTPLLYGNLDLPLSQYKIVVKSASAGYDIRNKIAERESRGYTLLPALPADDLEVVRTLIGLWQPVLFRAKPTIAPKRLYAIARTGIEALGGDLGLLLQQSERRMPRIGRVLTVSKPGSSIFDGW